jgi:hypothetical protein
MTILVGTMRGAMLAAAMLPTVAAAQVRTVDPSAPAVAGARTTQAQIGNGSADYGSEVAPPTEMMTDASGNTQPAPARTPATPPQGSVDQAIANQATSADPTAVYQDDDILGAAENVFGRGAEGLAKAIESVLKKQGRPNAYIAGREAGGAFVVGLRYGSGTMHHKIEGDRPVYWTGPSLGLDFGGSGAKTFVLVYNLYDSQELFNRFPAVEGQAYLVGGFNISYLRRKDVVLIPIRLGVGWRLGANVGYMKFSEKGKILPF